MSGGVVWMPGHGRSAADQEQPTTAARQKSTPRQDSIDDALRYVAGAGGGEVDLELVRAFLSDTGRVADAIENRTPIEWEVLEHWPDYRGELPGAKTGGRSMWPRSLRLPGDVEGRVQPAFDQPSPAGTAGTGGESGAPANDGVVFRGHVRGRALVGGLLSGLLDAGVEVRTSARATALEIVDDAVTGVVVDGELVPGHVVLATGGFQHDAALVDALPAGTTHRPFGSGGVQRRRPAHGDGSRLGDGEHVRGLVDAGHAGARVKPSTASSTTAPCTASGPNRGRSWWTGPGDGSSTRPRTTATWAGPCAARGGAPPGDANAPAPPFWLVFDAAYRRRYPVGPLEPGGPEAGGLDGGVCEDGSVSDPGWLARADDLDELGKMIGMESTGLADSVTRFNAGAAVGDGPRLRAGLVPL